MSNTPVIYLENDNLVALSGLKNVVTGAYVNTATVRLTLTDMGGSVVPGVDDVVMQYQEGSDGDYYGIIQDTVSLTDSYYMAEVTADAGGGLKAKWVKRIRATTRTE